MPTVQYSSRANCRKYEDSLLKTYKLPLLPSSMKIAPYVEKLHHSSEYHTFSKDHSDAFIVAGFFILDFENNQNVHQIDYYVPKEKKVAAFTLDGGVTMQLLALMNAKVPEKLDMKTKIDLDALKGILQDEMKNRSITDDIKKIIAVLHTVDGKKLWNLNCVLSGMSILKANIEDESQTVLKMEKNSIFDFIKKIPGKQLAQMQQAAQGLPPPQAAMETKGSEGLAVTISPSPVPQDSQSLKVELDKLNKLEQAIEKEKSEIKKQMDGKGAVQKEHKR